MDEMDEAKAEKEAKIELEKALKDRLVRKQRGRTAFKNRQWARGAKEDARIIRGVPSRRWAMLPSIPSNHDPNDEEIDNWIRERMKRFLKMEYSALRRAYFRFFKETEKAVKERFKQDRATWQTEANRFHETICPHEWALGMVIAESLQEIVLLHSTVISEREEQEIVEWTDSCRDIERVVHYHWDRFRRPQIAFAWKHTLLGDCNPMAKEYEDNRKRGTYGKRAATNQYLPGNESIARKKCRSTTHHL
jgi:hypothetical protein